VSHYIRNLLVPPPWASKTPEDWYRRRQARRRDPVAVPDIETVAAVENLAAVWEAMEATAGDGPGPDGITFNNVGRGEKYVLLRDFSKEFLAGTYRPGPSRTVKIAKARGGFRTLTIRNLTDRVVARALLEAVSPVLEPVFLAGSHGFRPGRSRFTLLADLARHAERDGRWVLAADDVRAAFDTVPIVAAVDLHRPYLTSNQLLVTIGSVLRGDDPVRAVGIAQGCPYSPLALNLVLHHAHDEYAQSHAPGANPGTPTPWYRYADNLVYLCRDVPEGAEVLRRSASWLGSAGLTLKGDPGVPADLRRGDQVELLGLTLYRSKNRLRLKPGSGAWGGLEEDLGRAVHPRPDPAVADRAIRGWIAAYGPALRRCERTVERLLDLAARYGFRELQAPGVYRHECGKAYQRWTDLVSRK
jgi:hypothetical protein